MFDMKSDRFSTFIRMTGILALFIALFAGKFSLDRFFLETSRIGWLELRIWCTLYASVAGALLLYKNGIKTYRLSAYEYIYISVLSIYFIYLVGNLYIIGNPGSRFQTLIDIFIILACAYLIILFFRSEKDIVFLAFIAEVTGVILFALCLLGFGTPDLNGAGWAPFGGPFTFYRIEFLSFCAALFLYSRSEIPKRYIPHLAIAGICLFSTLASLMKIALIGSLVVTLYFLYWLLSTQKIRRAIEISFVIIVVLILPAGGSAVGSGMKRISEVSSTDSRFFNMDITKIYSTSVRFEDLTETQQDNIKNIGTLLEGTAPDYKRDLPGFIRHVTRLSILNDSTYRINMAKTAMGYFMRDKWFGAGLGNYSFVSFNSATNEMETYRYPHNIVLEVLSMTGLVGIMLFGVAVFITLILLQQTILRDTNAVFFAGYALFIMITSLAAGDYYDFRLFWFISLIVTLSYQQPREQVKAA